MLARQRQERILDDLRRDGGVRISELVGLLGVSDMTVRRDIETLAHRGLLERVHGGATALVGRTSEEPGFAAKSELAREQKTAIARAAAEFVSDRESVAISAGTTTLAVARELLSRKGLTVVTNSPPVANLMHDPARPDRTVVLVGGIRTPSNALVGPLTVAALRTLHVDTLVLGVHGVTADEGLSTPNLMEAETNRALVACARRVILTVDHTKWGVVGLSTIADLERVDVLVTDSGISPDARRSLDEIVRQVVVAEVTRPAPGNRAAADERDVS